MKKLIKRILKANTTNPPKYEKLVRPVSNNATKMMLLSILRKNLVLIFCFLSFAGFSQAHFDIGSGIGTMRYTEKGNTSTSLTPLMRMGGGYEFGNRITTDAFMQVSISRQTNSPNFLGAKVGYDLNGFIPSVGYLFNYCNSDDKSQNAWGVSYAVKYLIPINDNGGLFIEGLYCQKQYQFSVGFHVVFNND